MCGVIGIISNQNRKDMGALVAHGLYQLQNRGDFSAGVATIRKFSINKQKQKMLRELAVEHTVLDLNPLKIEKGHGKVSEVFTKAKLSQMTGFMGVGQVRYPTAGYTVSASDKDLSHEEKSRMSQASIQPLHAPHGGIVIVHNGDVHNYAEIDAYFTNLGLRKAGNNDVEAILKVFSEEFHSNSESLDDGKKIEMAVRGVMERVKATYSAIAIINNVGLVAFRDPEGRRPLFYGVAREHDGNEGEITDYAFASETIALEKMLFKGTSNKLYASGRQAYDEIAPGEMIFINSSLDVIRKQIMPSRIKLCPFEASYFMRASSYLNNNLVKNIRKLIVDAMWKRFMSTPEYNHLMKHKTDLIICPVPRTAEAAAIHLANTTGIAYNSSIEKHPFSPRIFLQPTQEHRELDTIADHYVFREEVEGKYVIIVDDSIVRGTTIKHDIKYLRHLGAKEIHLFITFPAIRHPCNHAIDFHTTEELIAHGKSLPEIKKALGMQENEALVYATKEELSQAIGLPATHMCDECYVNSAH
ncbi:MAG: amidophosphoribosyltransferase [archaeon GW2011_AR3]|nr:MAG: amidophosphoribosyltransferase [archaeon GW2011_AR3]MBS3109945.1 hypothetical protein [Candidatus Woesearchaeota archaeon]